MDKAKHIVAQNESKLKWVLIACLGIHFFCCYCRTDYNVQLYLLLLYSWEPNQIGVCDRAISVEERTNSFLLLLFTILLDIVWLFCFRKKRTILLGFEAGMFATVFVLTIIGVLIKLILAFALGLLEWEMIKNYLPKSAQEKIAAQSQESRKEIMMES